MESVLEVSPFIISILLMTLILRVFLRVVVDLQTGAVHFRDKKLVKPLTSEGISKLYYESGGIKTTLAHKNGELINKKQYDEKSNLKYEQDDLKGITKAYYENGSIHYIETHKTSTLILKKEYDEKGNLISEQDFPIEEGK